MATQEKQLLAEKKAINQLADDIQCVTKTHSMNKKETYNIDTELARGIYMGGRRPSC